jgi:hypothetical protein
MTGERFFFTVTQSPSSLAKAVPLPAAITTVAVTGPMSGSLLPSAGFVFVGRLLKRRVGSVDPPMQVIEFQS